MHETKQFAAHIIDNVIINTIINITPPSVVFLVASDGEGLGEEEGRGEVNEEEKTDEEEEGEKSEEGKGEAVGGD